MRRRRPADAMGRRAALYVYPALAVALTVAGSSALAQSSNPAAELRALVESGRSSVAYQRYCGSTQADFDGRDLWCGVALVDIGRPAEAVMTLERYVLTNPNDMRGRLELARAYFQAGDDVRARTEFEAVAAAEPPAQVRAGISRYLDALFRRESLYRLRTLLYVEAGAGWDSNVNAGVAQADISLPILGRVTVLDRGIERSAPFASAALGGQINQPIAPGWSLFGSFDANGTFYRRESEFNLTTLSGSVGTSYESGANIYALSLTYGDLRLDNDRYRSSYGAGFEWRHALSPVASIAVAPQFARLRYAGVNEVRDADLAALALNYRRAWLVNWQPAINIGVFYGDESSQRQRPDLGRSLAGANFEFVVSPTPRWALGMSAGYTRSNYDGALPLLDVVRSDDFVSASLKALAFLGSGWTARFEYGYARNSSNVELYDFDRHTVGARLRREFK